METNKKRSFISKMLHSEKERLRRLVKSKKSGYTKISYIKITLLIIFICAIVFNFYNKHQKKMERREKRAAYHQEVTENKNNSNVILFKNYNYGLSRKAIETNENVKKCADPDLKNELCLKKQVEFLGFQWEQAFIFSQDQLESIMLYSDKLSESDDAVILASLIKNDYTPIYITDGETDFDVIENINLLGADKAESELSRFISDAENNDNELWITYVPNSLLKSVRGKNVKNLITLLKNASDDVRTIELYLSEELTALKFETPIAEIKNIQKRVKKERF